MALDGDGPARVRARQRLAEERIGWLTTVNGDGQPQTMPVWFLWADGELLVYSDHRARRNRNVAGNARVSFHLDADAGGGDVVVLEGEARIDPTTPGPDANPAYLAKYGAWIDAHLGGAARMAEVYNVPIRVRPTRLIAFGG